MEDDVQMGAIFAQVKLKLTDEWKEQIVYRDPDQVLQHPRTGEPVRPRPLGDSLAAFVRANAKYLAFACAPSPS